MSPSWVLRFRSKQKYFVFPYGGHLLHPGSFLRIPGLYFVTCQTTLESLTKQPPTSALQSNRLIKLKSPIMQLMTVATALVVACGLPGNALVVLTVSFNRHFHTAHYFLLASLACCDFISMAVVALPRLLLDWRTGDDETISKHLCVLSTYLGKAAYVVTICHLFSVSQDRYKAIVKAPMTYSETLTKRRVLWSIFFNCVLPAAVCVPSAMVHARYDYNPASASYCADQVRELSTVEKSISLAAVMPVYLSIIPLIAMVRMNYVTTKVAIRQTKAIAQQQRRQLADIDNAARGAVLIANLKKLLEYRAARDGLYVIGAFLVCYFPAWTHAAVRLASSTEISPRAAALCYFLTVCNCACNPVIYSIRKKAFRGAVKRLISSKSNQVTPLN